MRDIKDVMLLALVAGKQGKYDQAAKLFAACLTMDDVDQFIAELEEGTEPPIPQTVDPIAVAGNVRPLDTVLSDLSTGIQETVEASENIVDLSTFEQFEESTAHSYSNSDHEIEITGAIGPIGIK